MGIPAEDLGDISSGEESGPSEPDPGDASAFPGKPVDDGGDDEEEEEPQRGARSTQFGLPAVDRDEAQADQASEGKTPVPEPTGSQSGEAGRTGNWTGWKEQADSEAGEEPSEESVLSAWGISEAEEGAGQERSPEERETVQGTQEAADEPLDTHKTQMGMPRVNPEEISGDGEDVDRGNDPTRQFDEDSLAKVEEHVRALNEESSEPDQEEGASPGAGVVMPASSRAKSDGDEEESSGGAGETLHGQIPGAGSFSSSSGSYSAAKPDKKEDEAAGPSAADDGAGGSRGRQTMRGLMGKDLSQESGLEDTAQGGPTAEPPESDDDGSAAGGSTRGGEEPGQEEPSSSQPTKSQPGKSQPGQSGFGSDGPTGFKVDEPSEEIAIDGGVAENPFSPEASSTAGLEEPSDASTDEGEQEIDQRETSSVSELLDDWDESEEAAEPETDNVHEAAAEATGEGDGFGFFDSDDDSGFEMPAPDEIAVSVEEDDREFESEADVEPVDEGSGAPLEDADEDDEATLEPVEESFGTEEGAEATSDGEATSEKSGSSEPEVDPEREASEEPEPVEQPAPDSQPPAEPEEAPLSEDSAAEDAEPPAPTEDDQLVNLSQTVFGLIAGVSMGSFLIVQMMTIGFMGHAFFLALAIGGAIGAFGSLLLPFLPVDGGIRSASFVGIGLLVSLLAIAATVSGRALAVAPLIALFGGIFAIGAGLIPRVLAMIDD